MKHIITLFSIFISLSVNAQTGFQTDFLQANIITVGADLESTLVANIDATTTNLSITYPAGGFLPQPGILIIGNEQIYYQFYNSSGVHNFANVIRGYNGTSATSHNGGVTVYGQGGKIYLNENGDVWATSFSGDGSGLTNIPLSGLTNIPLNFNSYSGTGIESASNTAIGLNSTAMGNGTTASGLNSTAMGFGTIASENNSTALGKFNANMISNTAFVIGNGTGGARSDAMTVLFDGTTTIAGDLTINSDARLKSNIISLGSTLAKLLVLDGKSYTFKKDESKQKIGLLAQDVKEVFPELVKEATDKQGTLSVNYQGLIPVVINAMKEQDDIIKNQEERIERLELLVEKLLKKNH